MPDRFSLRHFSFSALLDEPSALTRRPLYRRIGGHLRSVLRRSLDLFDRASHPSGAPVPPAHLRV
jgi:hypothetical protein